MYSNGAGTCIIVILKKRIRIQWALPRGLSALYAAGAGSFRLRASVLLTGATTARTTSSATSDFVSPALSLQAQGKTAKPF